MQIVAFPQSGVMRCPGVLDLLDAVVREGADLEKLPSNGAPSVLMSWAMRRLAAFPLATLGPPQPRANRPRL